MYPIKEDKLSLASIARHWAECATNSPPKDGIRERLLEDFWRGAFIPTFSKPFSIRSALQALRRTDNPEIVFHVSPSLPQSVEYRNNGEIEFDRRTHIYLPTEPDDWTDEIIADASQNLAKAKYKQYCADFKDGFFVQWLTRDAFLDYCDRAGYVHPAFWGTRPRQRVRTTVKAETDCRAWLVDRVERNDQPRTKKACFEEARRLFPGLSRQSFDRIWPETVPKAWKRPGRKRKHPRSQDT
jgi:hypothetical protein